MNKFQVHKDPPGAPGDSGLERRKPYPTEKEQRKFRIKRRKKNYDGWN